MSSVQNTRPEKVFAIVFVVPAFPKRLVTFFAWDVVRHKLAGMHRMVFNAEIIEKTINVSRTSLIDIFCTAASRSGGR